jgi:hypothetical protein
MTGLVITPADLSMLIRKPLAHSHMTRDAAIRTAPLTALTSPAMSGLAEIALLASRDLAYRRQFISPLAGRKKGSGLDDSPQAVCGRRPSSGLHRSLKCVGIQMAGPPWVQVPWRQKWLASVATAVRARWRQLEAENEHMSRAAPCPSAWWQGHTRLRIARISN